MTETWIERRAAALAVALVVFGSLRIAATYPVFNHTTDEPAHLACGMEWLERGRYTYEPQHPPLARVAAAIGPYLAGRRIVEGPGDRPEMYEQGNRLLYLDNRYDRNLALARLGILPFFWIASAVVFVWGRKYFDGAIAVAAVFLFTMLPPVLAHAGLATTDMALTAFAGASFLSALLWAERPDARRSVLFGVCTGLAALSKFSALLFLPVAFAAALAWRVPVARRRALPLALAIAMGALVIWAGYRFSIGTPAGWHVRAPAPELFDGIREVSAHNAAGHPAYLLGMRSMHGWWYYYPVVLAVKTPLAFLALVGIGAWAMRRNARSALPLVFSLAILAAAMFTHVNIGVRHILPVYLGFSLTAAVGVVRGGWPRCAVVALLAWHAATSLAAHPDYIPYTNALAMSHPENVVVDSDLDWGQDMKRLAQRLREAGARDVAFLPLIHAYYESFHGFPRLRPLPPDGPAPGWNAASVTVVKARPEAPEWTQRIPPTERLGKTTYVWYVPARPADAVRGIGDREASPVHRRVSADAGDLRSPGR